MIDCFSHISTEERARRYSETRSRSNVIGTYTCWKPLIKLTFSMERLYRLTEGWYRNISLLPVPRTDSLNSLAEALLTFPCPDLKFFQFSSLLSFLLVSAKAVTLTVWTNVRVAHLVHLVHTCTYLKWGYMLLCIDHIIQLEVMWQNGWSGMTTLVHKRCELMMWQNCSKGSSNSEYQRNIIWDSKSKHHRFRKHQESIPLASTK